MDLTLDDTQRRAARVAGLALFLGMAIVMTGFYVLRGGLIVPDDAANTARNILAHETRFRLCAVFYLLYLVDHLILLSALHLVFRHAGRGLSLAAGAARMVYALMWAVAALAMFVALRLLGNASYLQVLAPAQLQALARITLSSGYDAYYVGLPFFALSSTLWSWLWLRSRMVPKALATFGLLASAWGVFCGFAFLIAPGFGRIVSDWLFDVPLGLFEMVLGLWLVLRGLREPEVSPQSRQR